MLLPTVLAYPGNMADAQNAARALHEAGVLIGFVTGFVWRPGSSAAACLGLLPQEMRARVHRQLGRRTISQVPPELVHAYPTWELLRTGLALTLRHPVLTDLAWDALSHRFDQLVAERYVPKAKAIQCFEYTALTSFKRAHQAGVRRILHLSSLDSRRFEEIQRAEKSHWPELRSSYDSYFEAKFERRYARRCEEIALADRIIANSSLTARSHIAAGADASKFAVVPLGAPPTIDKAEVRPNAATDPLKVAWAGNFSLGKGAHYLSEAWRRLAGGKSARLDVYGRQSIPGRLITAGQPNITFHGSVPQARLFEAFKTSDVLVFPTLSDGFGMVVAEAMAHGCPVITTDQAGAADLVTKNNGLIVPAADSEALAEALRWCLDNRARLSEMRFAALETARRRQWSDFRQDVRNALDVSPHRTSHHSERRSVS